MCVVTAVACAGVLSACGEDDSATSEGVRSSVDVAVTSAQERVEGAASSVQSAASSVAEQAGGWFDEAKLGAFVTAFRAAYPNLSADRETQSIETIVTETCPLIEDGADDAEVNAKVGELAVNGSAEPTDDQAARIAQLVRVACG